MHSFTEENYLKAIYKLSALAGEGTISTNAISEEMNTKAASVTDMLKRLSEKDLIHYVRYKGVNLTAEGRSAAVQIIRKHRLWEVFLVSKLGFGWEEVHEIAEELEHINSEELVNRLDEFLGFPQLDPHGDPIPTRTGRFRQHDFIRLSELAEGETGIVSGVGEHSAVFLQYLGKLGIQLGKKMRMIEKNPCDGSVVVAGGEGGRISLSKEASHHILVKN